MKKINVKPITLQKNILTVSDISYDPILIGHGPCLNYLGLNLASFPF